MQQHDYDHYNREERYLCAHLFRMLHEPISDFLALRRFLGDVASVDGFRIYTEVALLRDAYHIRRQSVHAFMDAIVQFIARQENVELSRLYSQLEPEELRTPHLTHPGQILRKGRASLTVPEQTVYGVLQGMFNAKPDLVICLGDRLFVIEAKWTQAFDREQLMRTNQITEMWSMILHSDLGFPEVPATTVSTLGLSRHNPDISWESITEIARDIYPQDDRSRMAFEYAVA